MPCASRGRTSCCRFGSHPQGPGLGDSFLQGRAGARRWRVWLVFWGEGLLASRTSWRSLWTEKGHPIFCPLVYRPKFSCSGPDTAALSCLPQPKGPSPEDSPLPKLLVASPDVISTCLHMFPGSILRSPAAAGSRYSCAPSRPKLNFSASSVI